MNFSDIALSNELKGTVCLGKNLAKVSSEHTERLYLKIGDSPKIYFIRPYSGKRVIAKNLDIRKEHAIKIFFDDQIVQSWKLNFLKLKTDSVLIWRASGSWRMEPNKASSCK